MSATLPASARVVIVGGGIVGCSVAYHLAKSGWTDTLLLERKQLTCGSTWHAAGLVSQLQAVPCMTELAVYGLELMESLEAETGQPTGFKRNGSIAVALNDDRMEELCRRRDVAQGQGVEARHITPGGLGDRWPLLSRHDVVGGIHFPNDGQTNPIDTTMALAKGARSAGARLLENISVQRVLTEGGRAVGVETESGTVKAEFIVNCTGLWARHFAIEHGVHLPIQANQHFYIVTDSLEGVRADLPVLRVYDEGAYYKEDAGKLLIGFSEPNAKAWVPEGGIPADFSFDELPYPEDHLTPLLEMVLERVPGVQETGVRKFFNGPESYTPDGRYVLGESPDIQNYFVAGGFNSTGLQSGPGAGKALAEWIMKGRPTLDLADVDVKRFEAFQSNHDYLVSRVPETLTLFYQMHWPYKQRTLGRGLRRSPFHEHLKSRKAVFGESTGWERPMWYAPEGVEARYRYAFGRAPWFEHWEAEHKALREDLGLLDLSPFAKFQVEGLDAAALLQRISANDIDVPTGRVVYTQWLNEEAGIEADLTIARLTETRFLVVTSTATARRDWTWLHRHMPDDARVVVTDITAGQAVLGVMGPRARDFLSAYSPADLSNRTFPFGTWQTMDIGRVRVRAQRLTYQGELGWEIFVSSEFAAALFEILMSGEKAPSPRLVGFHAAESLRMEKAYRHWGHDMGSQDTPLEAGLLFACKPDKAGGFIGRDALLRQSDKGAQRRLLQFLIQDPDAFIYHNEPVLRGGEVVGRITSGSYAHSLGGAVGLGYVTLPPGLAAKDLASQSYEIAVAGRRVEAKASLRPLYDPKAERVRG
jgi:4-methylaminobutanoate oxidase (formaldehyde-forming)